MYQELINGLKTLNLNDLQTVITFLGGGAVVSVIVETVKRKANLYVEDHEKLLIVLVAFVSVVLAAANYLVGHSTGKWTVIVPHSSEILAAALFIYHIGLSNTFKWLYAKLESAANWNALTAAEKTDPTLAPTIEPTPPTATFDN